MLKEAPRDGGDVNKKHTYLRCWYDKRCKVRTTTWLTHNVARKVQHCSHNANKNRSTHNSLHAHDHTDFTNKWYRYCKQVSTCAVHMMKNIAKPP